MSKRLALYVACLAMLGWLNAPAAWAQEEEEKPVWKVEWSNGHKMDRSDKAFSLKFGGRIQADYIFASQNDDMDAEFGEGAFQNGFEFRRARLFFEGTIYERVSFKAQYDFAGSGDPTFKDVWIALDTGAGDLKFGHFKEPMSINELTSSKYLAFNERASPVEMFAPSRNAGIGWGNSNDAFTYGLGVFYDTDDFGVSLNEDRHNITGRLVWRPFMSEDAKSLLHLGGSITQKAIEPGGTARFRSRPDNHFGPRPVDTGGLPADDTQIYQFEVAGVAGRLWYTGEYFSADVETTSEFEVEEPTLRDPTLDGWYAEAGFYLTDDYRRYKASDGAWDRQKPSSPWLKDGGGGAWEVAVRFDEVDITEAVLGDEPGEMANITVQLNWYPNPATRLMIGYVNTDVESADNSFNGSIDSVLIRWQVDF
jgi:phosphate-selective porin OprO/OprP